MKRENRVMTGATIRPERDSVKTYSRRTAPGVSRYIPRMTNRAIFCALGLGLFLAGPLHAQTDRWQVATDGDKYVWDVQLVRLDGNSLVVRQSDTLVRVPVKHINEIRLIQKTEVKGNDDVAGAMNALTGGNDEIHDLSTLDVAARLRAIEKILHDHARHPSAPVPAQGPGC